MHNWRNHFVLISPTTNVSNTTTTLTFFDKLMIIDHTRPPCLPACLPAFCAYPHTFLFFLFINIRKPEEASGLCR
jgi:hypothetical protein